MIQYKAKQYKLIDGLYIEENEDDFLRHLAPRHFVDENIESKKIDDGFLLRFLQNELNTLLQSFVNGGFSALGYVFYPLIKNPSHENIKGIERLSKVAAFLDKNGYDFSESIKVKGSGSKNFASALSSLYTNMSKIKARAVRTEIKPKCAEFDINSYNDLKYLSPVDKLKEYTEKELRPYFSGFYVHGSIATKDYAKGWSDLDTVGIISKGTIKNPKALLSLRNKMYLARKFSYLIDPLQHHGSIILSEYDLENYCQAYFPLPIFKYSVSLLKDDREVKVKVRDFKGESLNRFFWFVSYFRMLKQKRRYSLSSYETKNLLHASTLFPTLYLQAKGFLMYKKFSFGKAKKYFKKEWEAIDYVSSLRSEWKPLRTLPLIKALAHVNPASYYQLNSKLADIFDGIRRKNKIDSKKIIDGMFSISEIAWEELKKNVK